MRKKNLLYILSVVSMILVWSGCDKFLEEKSQDLYIPRTVEDYREFLAGEGLNLGKNNAVSISEYLDLLTDDVTESVNVRRRDNADSREPLWGYYTWQREPEIDFNNTLQADKSWEVYYHRILIANIILDKLDGMVGEERVKKDLEGESRFLRAWSYFMLVNTYADPYENATQAESTPAIPINDATGVLNRKLPKASLANVYRLIIADLEMAVKAFEASSISKSIHRPGIGVTSLLRSRVALYQKDYVQAQQWADKVISSSGRTLYDLTLWASGAKDRFFDAPNTELIFSYSSRYNLEQHIKASNIEKGCFMVSQDLLQLYDQNDVRLTAFYYKQSNRTKPYKYNRNASKQVYPYAFHLSEAYLIRAEAYVELGEIEKAMADLNTLRRHRIRNYTDLNATTIGEVRNLVRLERRLELSFEGLRWFDLRRWGRPALQHRYSSSSNSSEFEVYNLQEGDSRYTLPIPRTEQLNSNF